MIQLRDNKTSGNVKVYQARLVCPALLSSIVLCRGLDRRDDGLQDHVAAAARVLRVGGGVDIHMRRAGRSHRVYCGGLPGGHDASALPKCCQALYQSAEHAAVSAARHHALQGHARCAPLSLEAGYMLVILSCESAV